MSRCNVPSLIFLRAPWLRFFFFFEFPRIRHSTRVIQLKYQGRKMCAINAKDFVKYVCRRAVIMIQNYFPQCNFN
jgi:hypothetical protein